MITQAADLLSAPCALRVLVKRILREHDYPPDRQDRATATVEEQASLLSAEWAGT